MIEEAKLIVAALRTSCEENGSCPDCPVNYWCHAKNGDRLEEAAADLIESLSAQLECKAQPITCGECEYYGKSPLGSTLGWCRLDCKHRNAGFWCANADRRANK